MDGIIDQVRRMPLAEKRRLAEALRQAIAEELASGGGEPDRCPRCGCPAFVRKGRDAAGRQRWLCRGCGRTFGAGTLGLLARSKLPAAAWMEFAACMADALPLRETAARVGVSLYTAWFMRMRVCEVMGRRLLPARGESFEMDGTYFPESMPGNHSRGWFGLGRPAHRMLPPMYFPPFTPMIHNRSRQPAPAGYANVFPPLSAPPPNLSRNARASRARALSEPG